MKYLVDVNLPKSFSTIQGISCQFIIDISDEMPDSQIWEIAITDGYVILTRDKDFYYRAMQSKLKPKIVLFRLGNVKSKELFDYFSKKREIIEGHLADHDLLVLWPQEMQVMI